MKYSDLEGKPVESVKRHKSGCKAVIDGNDVEIKWLTKYKYPQVDLPDFVDELLWKNFVESRQDNGKPLDAKLATRILGKLRKFENDKRGGANESLDNSWNGRWLDVFPPKTDAFPEKPVVRRVQSGVLTTPPKLPLATDKQKMRHANRLTDALRKNGVR